MKVLIVGGGVIGLSIGLSLLRGGHDVEVLVRDPRECASRVAGGMLAPFSESLEGELLNFSLMSLSLFREFLEEVRELSGLDVFFSEGILRLAFSEEEENKLKRDAERLKGLCKDMKLFTREELLSEFPSLSEDVRMGILYGDEGNVDTEELLDALVRALLRAGGKLKLEDVLRTKREGERIQYVEGFGGRYRADFYVFATGAWMKEHFNVPVFPQKGQILRLRAPSEGVVLYSERAYVIPREKDVLVGATSENAGFDSSRTLGGVGRLSEGAIGTLPYLSSAELLEVRVGFRPATPDEKPVFYYGENFALFGGHYRNGILLAPATARVAFSLIDRGEVSEYFQFFSPYRFGK
ncbi:MAG: glycine oxidase ThiO [Aquificae bacterium]|nr:glycine oxidase ThiO [Aquificota bacterium]